MSDSAVADALAELPDDRMRCRFYENQYPEVDEVVVVQVKSIAEMGAYVALLEYDSIEGMILLSELSRRRIRSINKLIRVGRTEYVVVLRVDKEKGYIDLSKRRVAAEDIAKTDKRYNRAKAVRFRGLKTIAADGFSIPNKKVNSLLRNVAIRQKCSMKHLYETVAWPLGHIYEDPYEAFKTALTEPEKVFNHLPDIDEKIKKELLNEIEQRLTPQAVRVRADLELTCFAYEGVDAIRAALHAGVAAQTEQMPIKIKLLAPPLYVMWCVATEKEAGIELLEEAIKRVETTIKEKKGDLVVKIAPRSVNEREDAELTRMGDEEFDEDDEEGSEE